MDFDVDNLQKQIPYYLTASDQQTLVAELKIIASGVGTVGYFLSRRHDAFKEKMLQGDGWRGFGVFSFKSSELRSVRGIVLSNSCDIDPDNVRDIPSRVVYAPMVKLSAFKTLLEKRGISAQKIAAKIKSIKAQKTTNMFYLPANGPLEEEYVIRFDETHSMPVAVHSADKNCEKLFTLSNSGFYMLVFKLSVHFCRLQENISRRPEPS
jgi:hypothetical protein